MRRKISKIQTWHMVAAFAILVILAVFFLRINNVTMVDLRTQVITADESGDSASLQQSATRLRNYAIQHMNADTGQIALQHSYDTAVQRAFIAVNTIDSSGYNIATENCKAVLYISGYQGYASCVASAVGVSETSLTTPELPNPSLYYLAYTSPVVSFDPAGVTVVLASVVFLAMVLKLLTEVIMHFLLYKRQ